MFVWSLGVGCLLPGLPPRSEEEARRKAVGTWVCDTFSRYSPDARFKSLITVRSDGSYSRFVSFQDPTDGQRTEGYAPTDRGTWSVRRLDDAETEDSWFVVPLAQSESDAEGACRRTDRKDTYALCAVLHGSYHAVLTFDALTDGGVGMVFSNPLGEYERTCTFYRQTWTFDPTPPPAPPSPAPAPVPPPAPVERDSPPPPPVARATAPNLFNQYRAFRDERGCDPRTLPVGVGPDEMRLLRNTPYAAAGYTFSDPQLAQRFAAEPWYAADPRYGIGQWPPLDPVDAACVKRLKAAEDELRAAYGE